jgi:O-antigen/teichoic acid export membrane protein
MRSARFKWSLFTSFLTKPLAVALPAVTVPLFLHYLGPEEYGVYETVVSLAAWLGLTNLGLGLGLMNRLTDCFVAEDRTTAQRYTSTLFVTTAVLLVLFGVLLLAAVPFIPWGALFHTDVQLSQWSLVGLMGLTVVISLLTVFTGNLSPIYSAFQELTRYNLWDGVGKVLSLVACFLVVKTPLGLAGVVCAATGVPALVRLVNMGHLFLFEKPWLRPRLALFDRQMLRPIATEGFCFFLLQMAGVAVFNSDKVVLSAFLGSSAVTDYAIAGRVFLLAYGVSMLLLTPLWPAYGEALRRGDLAWIQRNLRTSLWITCGVMAALGGLLLWQGEALLGLWVGPQTKLSANLVLGMCAAFVLRAWVDCRSVVLNAAGYLRAPLYFWGAQAVLHVGLSVVLVRASGLMGLVWAAPISALLTTFWGYPVMIRRFLAGAHSQVLGYLGILER